MRLYDISKTDDYLPIRVPLSKTMQLLFKKKIIKPKKGWKIKKGYLIKEI
jgi:hypothetical protein